MNIDPKEEKKALQGIAGINHDTEDIIICETPRKSAQDTKSSEYNDKHNLIPSSSSVEIPSSSESKDSG